jgi:hypothetical protein
MMGIAIIRFCSLSYLQCWSSSTESTLNLGIIAFYTEMERRNFTDQAPVDRDRIDPNLDTSLLTLDHHSFDQVGALLAERSIPSNFFQSSEENLTPSFQPLQETIADSLNFRKYRTSLIETIQDITLEKNIALRNALGNKPWPWSLQTYENFVTDTPALTEWPSCALHVLLLIRSTYPLSINTLATTFFPRRSVAEVQSQ